MLIRPIQATAAGDPPVIATKPPPLPRPPQLAPENRFAVVQGRHCIAESHGCNVCVERCPVPGAITLEDGLPMVSASLCNGCGICFQECPAPTNAVMWVERRRPETP